MASGDAVQQIKDRLNILDVVGQYVELKQAGRHFKGRCPFHNEKSPSFHVSPDRGTYHCFGCGAGGDIFSFIEAIDGVDFKEALKTLAQKAGVELVPENPQKRTEREQLFAIIEAATAYYEAKLSENSEALAYLEKRGVTKETIKKWRIGYASGPPTGGWRELRAYLQSIGYKDDLLFKAGLIKEAGAGKEPFDVFRDRIMFPLRDVNGKVVAFSGRILHPDDKAPKYVNSPETELFHKSSLLYGYDFAKHHIRQLPFWLLVEGQFDVVMSHQAGYATAVAVSGTAFTVEHAKLLERLSTNVVLGLDTDKAGIAAMKKAADLMLARGMDVKVARFADGADPADMVQKDLKGFKQAIGQSVHIIEFLLAHLREQHSDDRAYKLHVRDEVIPFVTKIPNRIDQEHFENIIAGTLGTTKEAIHFEVTRILEQQKNVVVLPNKAPQPPTENKKDNNTLALKIKTEAYLLAAITIVTEDESSAMKKIIEEVSGIGLEDVLLKADAALISALTFSIETEFDKMSTKVRRGELVHKLNQYREAVLKDRLSEARQNDGEEGLVQISALTKLLQQPPYTSAIFGSGD